MPFGLTLGKGLIYLFAIITILGMIGTGVYKIKQWGANEVRAEWDAANAKKAEQALTASNKLEADKGKANVIYKTIKESVAVYIDRPVYRNECIDDDGLRDINRALNPTSESGGTVSGPGPTGR